MPAVRVWALLAARHKRLGGAFDGPDYADRAAMAAVKAQG